MNTPELLASLASGQGVVTVTGLAIILSTAIALGAIVMQFLSLLRHDGGDAVDSSLTWLLLAAFAAAMGAFFHQQLEDFFLVLLMALLASGAMASWVLNLLHRETLRRVREERLARGGRSEELAHEASGLRVKLRLARRRQGKEPGRIFSA